MGFLDNITQSLNNLSQQVIAQGSNLAGTAQNRVKMMDIDRQLEKAFAELGRAYFEANRNTPAPEYADAFTKIKDLLAQNEFYKAETRRERGLVLCPKCGAEVAMGVAFCNSCGASMPPVDMTQQNVSQPYTVVRCPQCGLELPNGTSFCTSCGTNLQNVQPAPPAMPLGMLNMTGGSLSTPMSTQQPMPTQQPAPMPTPMSTQQPVPMPTPMPMQQPVPMPTPDADSHADTKSCTYAYAYYRQAYRRINSKSTCCSCSYRFPERLTCTDLDGY